MEFPAFPFKPYPIQTDFMNFLYHSLDRGGISILESPTGTGKTLSIICSTLQWLLDQKLQNKPNVGPTNDDEEEEPDWMRDFQVEAPKKNNIKKKVEKTRVGFGVDNLHNAKNQEKLPNGNDEAEFLVEEYESEEESGAKRRGRRGSGWSSSEEESEEKEERTPKIFFTSRTHSQLSQFVKEFRRTGFAGEINLVCLGSRKNMCINPEVAKLGSSSLINERCLELQKKKKDSKAKVQNDAGKKSQCRKTSCGCPMLGKQNLRELFMSEAQENEALDIEDLVQLGSKIGSCPYYASRDMVRASDLVVLPYQSLFLRSARESLGLNLMNSVIVIDEAHNLADSLTSMYNSKVTLSQLKQVLSHLELYLDRFRSRLGAGNRRYILILIVLTKSFLNLLLGCEETANPCRPKDVYKENKIFDLTMTINEFTFSLDIDNVNFVKLHHYIKESNIIQKISGYALKLVNSQTLEHTNNQRHGAEGSVVSSFQALLDILISLINNDSDGRIIVSRQKSSTTGQIEEGQIKFVMLSGEKIFSEVMDQAHAVVLAGGTLQPIEETRVRLFPGISDDQVHFFSCKHIVPPESILPIAVSRGPSGKLFDFSFNSRSSPNMIDELGRLLGNLVVVIPEGIVIFFSSFDYEGQVYDAWKSSGILPRILKRKHIFREPRSSNDIELVLEEYKEAINKSSTRITKEDPGLNGALLLAVVGGKISEGINFSDGMGRCVIMVGLPYPSPSDVELMERVKHIEGLGKSAASTKLNDNTAGQSGFEILRSCMGRGREYYDNLCMKAVNQSIGRAIRHANDYAAVLLVDSRYACNPSSQSFSRTTDKLPLWIKERLVLATENYGEVHKLLHQFFQYNSKRVQ